MNQKKAAIYTLHGEDPCATIRLLSPLSAAGLAIYKPEPELDIHETELTSCDFIIIQRSYPKLFKQYARVMEIARGNKIPVIFEIDDFLFDLPHDHIERLNNVFTEGLLPMVQAMFEADCVTVPTTALREKLLPYNQDVRVLPNYLDGDLWKLRASAKADNAARLVIGYMGTETHKQDLEMLVPVFTELEEKHPGQLTFRFWGLPEIPAMTAFESVEYIPPITGSYPRFAELFQTQHADIFVAPLRDNAFNRCKSPIKFFEYSALGAPGVYIDLEPYQGVIRQGENGFLAGSIPEWFQHLDALVSSEDLRYEIASRAQETLRENWMLSSHAAELREVYSQLSALEPGDKGTEQERVELVSSINEHYFMLTRRLKRLETDLTEKNRQVLERDAWIREKDEEITARNISLHELNEIKASKTWKIALLFRKARMVVAPPGSRRSRLAGRIIHFLQGERIRFRRSSRDRLLAREFDFRPIKVACGPLTQHFPDVDVIICVHNALEDVRRCVESVVEQSTRPFRVIIVDDGSDAPTKTFLEQWSAGREDVSLVRNEQAQGYTLAANIGMRASTAEFLVLLNSDTIVSAGWLDRLCRAMDEDAGIGVVGPLSNTASWQSIPELSDNGDWALNPLPAGVSIEKMAGLVAGYSGCVHPEVPLLNGFCMMIRREALDDIGLFDEENFGQGYGEEDDFNLRAGEAGWKKVIADDVFVFHAQSKSYSSDRRYQLSRISGARLAKKHGSETIAGHVAFMNPNRVMEGIRARTKVMLAREELITQGYSSFAGKRVLFVLPVIDAGGGANVILDEAHAMQKMGVDVKVMNLPEYKHAFLQNYGHSSIPFIFESVEKLPKVARDFDTIIATAHYSVPWFKPLEESGVTLGYYVQGYEALMYPEGSAEAQAAINSYTEIKGMRLFTKTDWTRQQIARNTGAICNVVGVSVNIDLLRPRDSMPMSARPVRVGAMIRPASPYRNPELTARVFRDAKKKYGSDLEIYFFGANDVADILPSALLNFDFHQLGKLTQLQVAALMSQLDVFADYSSHQAMGLSALEAMCAGATVIVPRNGGAVEFVRHGSNGMVVDTTDYQESLQGLVDLIENDQLRQQLQLNAIHDVTSFYPERAALNILRCLFEG